MASPQVFQRRQRISDNSVHSTGAAAVWPFHGHIYPERAGIRPAALFHADLQPKATWCVRACSCGSRVPASLPLMETVGWKVEQVLTCAKQRKSPIRISRIQRSPPPSPYPPPSPPPPPSPSLGSQLRLMDGDSGRCRVSAVDTQQASATMTGGHTDITVTVISRVVSRKHPSLRLIQTIWLESNRQGRARTRTQLQRDCNSG